MKKSFDIVFGITEKQYKCIRNIEFWTVHKFTGTTRKEATKFIAQYRRASQKNEQKYRQGVREFIEACEERNAVQRSGWHLADEDAEDCFAFSYFT